MCRFRTAARGRSLIGVKVDRVAESPEAVRARLGAPSGGWSSAQAAAQLQSVGENRLEPASRRSWPALLARQFLSPIEIILIAATVLAGFLGDWTDSFIILAILLLSGILGFVQEHNAGRAVQALLATVEVTSAVRRDGELRSVPLTQVVPGDVAVVGAGDLIPGDCLVLEANGLTVDESALTGETFPVDKRPRRAGAVPSPGDAADDVVSLGTHVASGSGTLLVVDTGRATRVAAIAQRLASRPAKTRFESGMTRFGLLLTRAMVVLVVIIFVINLLLQRPPIDAALFSLALAVGLTPQLLPAIVAIGLSQGARAMARKRVIVRRLDAIEDIGSMTVLCSDKTGTMTAGEIRLGSAVMIDGSDAPRVAALAALNAGLQTGWKNPIDDAILAAHPLPADATRLGEVPYDFQRKRVSVLTRDGAHGEPVLITKGALDAVLDVCARVQTPGGVVPLDGARATVERAFADLSAQGYRVLGVATRGMPPDRAPTPSDETGLTLIGLLTFADPVKPGATDTLARLAESGVSVRMVTGDNRLVAAHVAAEVGLDTTTVYTGDDIDLSGDAALARAVDAVHVFCELNPVQKERVIRAFRRAGNTVGYLGDGINDAPPLHAADVGITVDTAVAVARQSAAVVLLDKDLAVILDGVRQGRRTFANTMKYIFVTTSANFGNMLSMAVAAAVLPFLPLLAGQILLVNLLSDLPAMAIAADKVDESQLRRPQQWDLRLIRTFMIVFGALSSVFDLLTFAVLRLVFDAGAAEFRSAWLLGSILTEVGVLFILRTRGPFYRSRPGTGLLVISAVVVAMTLWLPFSPVAAPLQLVPVPLPLLAFIVGITLAYLLANEVAKRVFWKWRGERMPRHPSPRDPSPGDPSPRDQGPAALPRGGRG